MNYLLDMGDVVLLVPNHFLVGLDLGYCYHLVRLYLLILGLDLSEFLV